MPFEFAARDDWAELILVTPGRFADDRGWFSEAFRSDVFTAAGLPSSYPQHNHSYSRLAGTLRGIHLQVAPYAQGKLVRCLAGKLLDVAVDLRFGSARVGRHCLTTLDARFGQWLWLPPGFGHAILTLEDATEVLYLATARYSPEHERSIRWDDPELAIPWPTADPSLSVKDARAGSFEQFCADNLTLAPTAS